MSKQNEHNEKSATAADEQQLNDEALESVAGGAGVGIVGGIGVHLPPIGIGPIDGGAQPTIVKIGPYNPTIV